MILHEIADPAAWRAWLAAHAGSALEAWVVVPHAHSGRVGLTHREALEEALCFGWIDGLARSHDASAWRQRFSPRAPRSAWSTLNRDLVARLEEQGRMTDAGRAAVEVARHNGMWLLLADAQAGIVPADLQHLLDTEPEAAARWAARRPSERRAALEAIARARRPDTRTRRVRAATEPGPPVNGRERTPRTCG